MRIDEELLAALDAQAEADGMNRTQFLIMAIRARLGNAPTLDGSNRLPRPKTAKAVAATVPGVSVGIYSRPKHAPDCKCGVCGLSKDARSKRPTFEDAD